MAGATPSLMRRIARLPAEIIVGIYILADMLVAPLFRPLMRALSGLRLVKRLESGIAALPPYVILVLLVVPFAIAELAKVYAVFLMGTGHFKTGMTIFIGAYIVSIFVCERTFSAGKGQLMTIGWFAKGFGWVMAVKDHIFGWLRSTAIWRFVSELREKARGAMQRLRTRFGTTLGGKPGLSERR